MNDNNKDEMPQNGESQPQDPAMDQNNKAPEPSENKPAADNNNQPEKSKKPRKTDAEQLVELQKKLKKIADMTRKVKARAGKKGDKDLVKLKIVIGDSCLNYIYKADPEHANRLVAVIRKSVSDCNREWLNSHFKPLLALHAKPKPNKDDANG